MPDRAALVRQALVLFLPVAALATLACGLAYLLVQQDLRSAANDPQIQMAEEAGRALDAGAAPASLVGARNVDVAGSVAPFLVIFRSDGSVLATDAMLDGHDPVPPAGVLDHARSDGETRVTWQPRAGVRVATVTVRWSGGTVMAGRSLRETEARTGQAMLLAGAGWLVMLAALAGASLVGAWIGTSSLGPAVR